MTDEVRDGRDLGAFIPAQLDDYGLDVYEFRVYCHLARRAGQEGCYEGNPETARLLGIGERKVRECKQLLELAGLIKVTQRKGTTDLVRLTAVSSWRPKEHLETLRKVARRPRQRTADRSGPTDRGDGGGADVLPLEGLERPDNGRLQEVRSHGPGGSGPPDRGPTGEGGPVPGTDKGTPAKGKQETSSPARERSTSRSDPLFEVVCEVCGIDWRRPMPDTERGRVNRAVRELRTLDATPDQVRVIAGEFRRAYDGADLTPQAITGNWQRLASRIRARRRRASSGSPG